MRRIYLCVSIIIGVGVFSLHAQSIDELSQKHIAAIGGQENINFVESFLIQGVQYQDDDISQFKFYRKGTKFRSEITTKGHTRISGHDGKKFWNNREMQQNDPEAGQMNRDGRDRRSGTGGRGSGMRGMRGRDGGNTRPGVRPGGQRRQPDLANVRSPFYNAIQEEHKFKIKGKIYIDAIETYRIEGKDKNKNLTYYYIDTQDHLLVKMVRITKMRDRKINIETLYSDYLDVDGIMVPHAINKRIESPMGIRVLDTVIATVEINLELDDKLFNKPLN
ncbi:hypothetical protein KAR48_05225 [bacterium]|nr:hypothetical protein [bacterium]